MKKVLILGGTNFVGRNITEFLCAQEGVEITLFNRGVSNPELFKGVRQIFGDRNIQTDLRKLFTEDWDFIIDVSCYFPHQLRYVLKGDFNNLRNYIFISTCSVYSNEDFKEALRDETAPTLSCSKAEETDESLSSYGNRKAACERILINSGLPYVIFRPALIYGKYDPTDRFYYWLYQVKHTNKVILPEGGKRKFSLTFIDDLVQAVYSVIQTQAKNEVFNCISEPLGSIAKIVSICEELYNRRPQKFSASTDFLEREEIEQWFGIPLWLNSDMFTYSNEKIRKELSFKATELENGIKRTTNYYESLGYPKPQFGIDEGKKLELADKLRDSKD